MKTAMRLVVIGGAAAMLGGCQSFPLTSWMFKGKDTQREGQALAGNTAGALDEGRAHLDEGNISAAVASFRIALLDRATRAEASNGLAVAYARLGREDIAERYFQAAIAAEPDNTKFVANLLRLQQAVLARRAVAAEKQLAVRAPAPAQDVAARAAPDRSVSPAFAAAFGAASEASPLRSQLTGPLDRVSRSEVRVRARPEPGNAPAMAISFRNPPAEATDETPAEAVAQDSATTVVALAGAQPVTVVFGE